MSLKTIVRALVLLLAVLILSLSFDQPARALTGSGEFPQRREAGEGRVEIGQALMVSLIEIPNEPEEWTRKLAAALIGLGATATCPGECLEYVDREGAVTWFRFNP
jgi:hypothetical protein